VAGLAVLDRENSIREAWTNGSYLITSAEEETWARQVQTRVQLHPVGSDLELTTEAEILKERRLEMEIHIVLETETVVATKETTEMAPEINREREGNGHTRDQGHVHVRLEDERETILASETRTIEVTIVKETASGLEKQSKINSKALLVKRGRHGSPCSAFIVRSFITKSPPSLLLFVLSFLVSANATELSCWSSVIAA